MLLFNLIQHGGTKGKKMKAEMELRPVFHYTQKGLHVYPSPALDFLPIRNLIKFLNERWKSPNDKDRFLKFFEKTGKLIFDLIALVISEIMSIGPTLFFSLH